MMLFASDMENLPLNACILSLPSHDSHDIKPPPPPSFFLNMIFFITEGTQTTSKGRHFRSEKCIKIEIAQLA